MTEHLSDYSSSGPTIGEGVGQRHPVARQLLEGPELVHAVEYGLGPVDEAAAHLLQVPQHGDVAVRLHPGRGHPHYHHLRVGRDYFLLHSQTCGRRQRINGKRGCF